MPASRGCRGLCVALVMITGVSCQQQETSDDATTVSGSRAGASALSGGAEFEEPSGAAPGNLIGGRPAATDRTDVTTAPTHHTERVALEFVNAVRRDGFANHVPDIPADAELSLQDRAAAFRTLELFIKSQDWSLWFTSVEVIDGEEDSVDCYLRGTRGDMLVLLLGYHYDAEEWRIGAYEIPERTFARPGGESYEDYIARNIADARRDARPFSDGIDGDGQYFIDYRVIAEAAE